MLVHGEKSWSGEVRNAGASSLEGVRSKGEGEYKMKVEDYEAGSWKFMVEGGNSRPVTAGAA